MTRHHIPNDTVLDIYTRILRIRRFEEQVGKLFGQGQLPGFVHLYIGEEAVGAGVCAALGLPCEDVTPVRWKKTLMDGMAKEKEASVAKALQLWPQVGHLLKRRKDHNRADAMLLAEYGRRTRG